MDRINNFFLKNFNFNFYKPLDVGFINIDNSHFFLNTNRMKNLFFFKNIYLKKINLSKKCINVVYF